MSAPLPHRITARNVRPRVADKNRAERIRKLKKQHPGMTWGYIADRVGVELRSATEWQKTGGISAKNAVKLAELFGVSYDYLWFGEERGPTPDPLANVSGWEQVESVREEFRPRVREIIDMLKAAGVERLSLSREIDRQNELLQEQSKILKELVAFVGQLPALQEIAQTIRALRGEGDARQRGRQVLPEGEPRSPDEGSDSQRAG